MTTPILKPRTLPTEHSLKTLLANGMTEAVQQLLDTNPELKFKIETGVDGLPVLVDCVTGAALWLKKFITADPETIAMKIDAMKLSAVNDEVLILGETGTGKEIIARAMIGDRTGKFCRINCGAMPDNLIESELFGHVAGAFTGASTAKKGLMEAAKDGVLFLDEIGDLPLTVQAKLLNSLQPVDGKRYIRPVGGTEEREINCRIVCATHKDVKEMVEKGLFRKDLYARISTFELSIKPLRQRKVDIEPIILELGETLKIQPKVKEFIAKFKTQIFNDDLDLSLNVRSLEQALKRYNVLGRI